MGLPPGLLPILCVLCAVLTSAACSGPHEEPNASPAWLADLERESAASQHSGADPSSGDPSVHRRLDLYHELWADLTTISRRAEAEARLHAIWSDDPQGMLWPELASIHRNRLSDPRKLQSIFDSPEFPPAESALGAYLREWRASGPRPDGSGYEIARPRSSEFPPFERAWFALRLARHLRSQGHPDSALAVSVATLPDARSLGGPRLEWRAWATIHRCLVALDQPELALEAAHLGERLARAAWPDGVGPFALESLLQQADGLAALRRSEEAIARYQLAARSARDAELLSIESRILSRGATFAGSMDDHEQALSFNHQALRNAELEADSLNVPRHLSNLARRYGILGDLDSSRVYLEAAEKWIRAYPAPSNLVRFPLMQAEYFGRIGEFAKVESLHAVAAELTPNFSPVSELAELHLQLIQQGHERGRPDQAYRSVAFLDSLRSRLHRTFSDRNEGFDLEIATADFLAGQGLFRQADEALRRADEQLQARPDPTRTWQLAGRRGDLAVRRGDAAARDHYHEALRHAEASANVDRIATSRFWLATYLLELEQDEAAATVLEPSRPDAGVRYRTDVSLRLLRSELHRRRGDLSAALGELEFARAGVPELPADLATRRELATSRIERERGNFAEARRALERARTLLPTVATPSPPSDDWHFHQTARRATAFEWLELLFAERDRAELLGEAAIRALTDIEDLVLDWDDPVSLPLARPQIIFLVGRDHSFRWTLAGADTTLRRLPGEAELIAALTPILADLSTPARNPVAGELLRLTRLLGGLPPPPAAEIPVVIVPDGPLFAVPWPLLVQADGTSWIEDAALVLCARPRPRTAPGGKPPHAMDLLAVGTNSDDAAAAAGLGKLRFAEREAREIAQLWPEDRALVHLGDTPLRPADLGGPDVIHVASHVLVYQGRPSQTTLFLGRNRRDPWTAAAIRETKLSADLVFLSCCEAAERVRRGSSPAVAGLARSFLEAGAGHVVASANPVDDEAARHLALSFYRRWRSGDSLASALRAAQLELRDETPWSHPHYWALYQLIGR